MNVYSEFKRADGHVLWMHDDQWEGQNWSRSPGNIYGAPQKVHFDPKARAVVKLVADKVIPPIADPGRQRVRAALQVPEPVAHEVLGTADLPRRDGAAAARLQDVDDQLSGQLHPGPLRTRRAVRVRGAPGGRGGAARGPVVPRRVAVRQLPAHHRRHVPAPDAVLRRFVRREHRERRPLRRRAS